MSSSISNGFGFNMGAKMGDFGIYESNSVPTPPTPQPKYIVLNISFASGSVSAYTDNINTTTANVTSVSYVTGASNYVKVEFDNDFASNKANVYCEAFFNETWYAPLNDRVPLFQVVASTIRIDIIPIDEVNTNPLVDGDFQLSIIVFE